MSGDWAAGRLWALWAALAAAGVVYALAGRTAVPFHPDESTYIYMSRDFADLFLEGRAGALAWRPDQALTPEGRYRLLDAPATRYVIGLSWWLAGYTRADLNVDWAWDQPWLDNAAAGRLPSAGLLAAARVPAVVLGVLAAFLAGGLAGAARGAGVGAVTAGLLVFHPLMQLHTRRAMAEGPLLFASVLAVGAGLYLARRLEPPAPVNRRLIGAVLGTGAALGLALACKHSAAALAPAVLAPAWLAVGQRPGPRGPRLGLALGLSLGAALAAGLVVGALNPVMWAAPAETVRAMWAARVDLAGAQALQLQTAAPEQLLPAAADRLRAVILELYLRPPAVWDLALANQSEYLGPAARAYFAEPGLHQWPLAAGAGVAALTVAGLAFSALRLIRNRLGPATRAEQAVWAWGLAMLAFILGAVAIDWQRYFLPLLPPALIFAALGAEGLAAPFLHRFSLTKAK